MVWLEARAVEHAGPAGVRRIVGTTFDITQRKAIEQQVWRAANHDALTGLVNRTLFQKRLEDALHQPAIVAASASTSSSSISTSSSASTTRSVMTPATPCCIRRRIGCAR